MPLDRLPAAPQLNSAHTRQQSAVLFRKPAELHPHTPAARRLEAILERCEEGPAPDYRPTLWAKVLDATFCWHARLSSCWLPSRLPVVRIGCSTSKKKLLPVLFSLPAAFSFPFSPSLPRLLSFSRESLLYLISVCLLACMSLLAVAFTLAYALVA
eukprot:6183460-Pleurochrysis_carterae.AAC.2